MVATFNGEMEHFLDIDYAEFRLEWATVAFLNWLALPEAMIVWIITCIADLRGILLYFFILILCLQPVYFLHKQPPAVLGTIHPVVQTQEHFALLSSTAWRFFYLI